MKKKPEKDAFPYPLPPTPFTLSLFEAQTGSERGRSTFYDAVKVQLLNQPPSTTIVCPVI